MRLIRLERHRRSRTANKTVAIVAALVIGGGGAAAIAATAFANNGGQGPAAAASTIDCPDVSMAMGDVPEKAKEPVGQKLAEMDAQVAQAFGQLKTEGVNPDEVLGKLNQQRAQTIQQMGQELQDAGGQAPDAMQGMADCKMKEQAGQQAQEGVAATGPVAEDFVDINQVQPNVEGNQTAGEGGSFTNKCGKNDEQHFNADNVIAAPGVKAGAHHVHDYVGNLDTSFQSSDQSLAAADTTCANDDQSTHYWPVIRSLDGKQDEVQIEGNKRGATDDAQVAAEQGAGQDQQQGQDQQDQQQGQDQQDQQQGQDQQQEQQVNKGDGGQADGNVGTILQPASATIKFIKGGSEDVTAMPQFLRIITGDAKSFINGDKNANASWSCEGFEDKVQLKDKYPICPEGAQVIRTFKFQNCWDGQNTDSGNHRDHMSFQEEDGTCPDGFKAVPQLTHRLAYDIPQKNLLSADTPFAVDSFQDNLHKPITDHDDFINVMPADLMNQVVDCVNGGKKCDSNAEEDTGGGKGSDSKPGKSPEKPKDPKPSASSPDEPSSASDSKQGDSYSSAMKRDKPSSESDAKQDKPSSASDSKQDDPTPAAESREEGAPPPDRVTQLAKDGDGDLPSTGSNTPVGLIVGIGAAVVAIGSATVWQLRRRKAL